MELEFKTSDGFIIFNSTTNCFTWIGEEATKVMFKLQDINRKSDQSFDEKIVGDVRAIANTYRLIKRKLETNHG